MKKASGSILTFIVCAISFQVQQKSPQFSYRNMHFWANDFRKTGRINLEEMEITDDISIVHIRLLKKSD